MQTYPRKLQTFSREELKRGYDESESDLMIDALAAFRELKLRHRKLHRDIQAAIAEDDRGLSKPLEGDAD